MADIRNENLDAATDSADASRRPPLSGRERQVLDLASRGLTNAEAGLELGISVHAVKFHLASIYRKLGVANRTEAAVMYLRHRDAPSQATG